MASVSSNKRLFIENVKKKCRDASLDSLAAVKKKVIADAYYCAVDLANHYGYAEYAVNFRFGTEESYAFLRGTTRTSGMLTLDGALARVNNSYQQRFFLTNISFNPETGYSYVQNVEELGWRTVGFFRGTNGKSHPISAKHPFSPERAPKRILDDVAILIQR